VVVKHPLGTDGTPVSGCSVDVSNTTKIGVLFNTHFEDGKLKSEAWLFKDKLRAEFPQIYSDINSGNMLEVSTGLFTDA
jgi:hypothetical protein